MITRTDITNGYQNVQSTHSIADFILEYPEYSKKWKTDSNSIICLGVKNERELFSLYSKFKDKTPTVLFREPDIDNQLTSICLYGTPDIRKKLKHLPLLGKQYSVSDLHLKMQLTPQTKNQSVLEHGISVNKYFDKIIFSLKNNVFDDIKIPEIFIENKDIILNNILPIDIIKKYLLYHDCGKPFCITTDIDGKNHFPDHANISKDIYLKYFGFENNSYIISELIKHDMDFHILKPSLVDEYIDNNSKDKQFIFTLLLATLSELNSNAMMFGGYDSDSFKIKFKNFTKISNKIITKYK